MEKAGLTFASLMSLGPDLAVSTAVTAEGLGYRSFWTAETTGPEAFSLLGAVGTAAPGLDLGTGVLALQLRTPMVVAMAGATLQALRPERAILLGIGISSPVGTERWHGGPYGDPPPAPGRVRGELPLRAPCVWARGSTSPATSTTSRASAWGSDGPSGSPRSWSAR